MTARSRCVRRAADFERDDRVLRAVHSLGEAGDELAATRDDHERSVARVFERDRDPRNRLRKSGDARQHAIEERAVAVEREGTGAVVAFDATQTREEVHRVAHAVDRHVRARSCEEFAWLWNMSGSEPLL